MVRRSLAASRASCVGVGALGADAHIGRGQRLARHCSDAKRVSEQCMNEMQSIGGHERPLAVCTGTARHVSCIAFCLGFTETCEGQ
jgi:hypothetical protein